MTLRTIYQEGDFVRTLAGNGAVHITAHENRDGVVTFACGKERRRHELYGERNDPEIRRQCQRCWEAM